MIRHPFPLITPTEAHRTLLDWPLGSFAVVLPCHQLITQEMRRTWLTPILITKPPVDNSTSDLLLLGRGLGLRRVIYTLMQIYESPQNLVVLVNATPSEETGIATVVRTAVQANLHMLLRDATTHFASNNECNILTLASKRFSGSWSRTSFASFASFA